MPIMAFKCEGKEMYPILVLERCFDGQFTPKWFGKNAHSKQRKVTPT